jgi:hypothetical protein
MLMSPDELAARFRREIDRRGTDDRYIDLDEERELLQIALAFGFEAGRGRALLADVCRERGYVVERALRERVRAALAGRAGKPLRKGEFARLAADLLPLVAGTKRTARDLRRLAAQEVADTGTPVRSRWPFDWWAKVGEPGA